MDKFKDIFKYISFTKSESKVIIFIVLTVVIGFSIKYYKYISGTVKTENKDYFSKTDERFIADSKKMSNPDFDNLSYEDKVNIMKASDDSLKNAEKNKISLSKKEASLEGKQIDINSATKEELMELPGIGESMASRIIEYRENNDGFKKIEDLMEVKGIGDKKFEKLKKYIKTE